MASSLVDSQGRARLRDKYKQAARSIIQELQSRSKPAYTHTELAQIRVSVQSVDPEDHKFTDSEACLFPPLTQEELETYKIDKKELSKDEHRYITDFKGTFNDPPGGVSESCLMWERAGQILFYLKVFESNSERKSGRSESSIKDLSHWDSIKAENSFHETPTGMLRGFKLGHSKPQDLPRWNAYSTCQWLDDFEDPKTTRPHIKLLTLTGAKAKENELLHGELAPIANVLYCRLEQPEFENTSLFPVLVISLFGPRHGRLLQAKFDNSGTLLVRSSPIYDFVDSDEKIKLFVRYNNCKPRDGPEIEPVLVDEQSPSPRVQHQASLFASNKENLFPQK
ncbi:hypothetical protein EN45_097430 [Penicillium chrysogenum]|uniref:Pc22g08270 protein n=2 Tax=Penicillium chrysogenum species complex TaxID=254878 RepID=B6HS92_PENRW|nr:uncharacterized protein N7525_005413 [Penicillium rubens]KAJ5043917.1 hypothetical protein NUH16_000711 [Penicillium rubens]KAJ5840225.1 hypothetical protein N7525_005413 [Penicillium rubens]KZN85556.1 hypothetical protein EN45_097430 [Penicillium chrysogenum]CAP98115.1 Pc22g08270 [Penicillium rubens Wisconsin 54-1255]